MFVGIEPYKNTGNDISQTCKRVISCPDDVTLFEENYSFIAKAIESTPFTSTNY